MSGFVRKQEEANVCANEKGFMQHVSRFDACEFVLSLPLVLLLLLLLLYYY